MEKLHFLYNKVIPLKSIIYINILVFNTHQSHILTFTSTVVSSVGEFVVPGVEFMYLYSLCAAVMIGDGSTFHFASIYSGCCIYTIKLKSSFWRCFRWLSNMFDGGEIKIKYLSNSTAFFFYCQFKKLFKKYFCIKCTLDAKEKIWSTTRQIYCFFFVGDFVSMAMCFRSHLILFMKHIKAAGLNKGRTIRK